MKWGHPTIGVGRYIKKFLWLPKRIKYETRWFEFVTISQSFQQAGGRIGQGKWVDENFVD